MYCRIIFNLIFWLMVYLPHAVWPTILPYGSVTVTFYELSINEWSDSRFKQSIVAATQMHCDSQFTHCGLVSNWTLSHQFTEDSVIIDQGSPVEVKRNLQVSFSVRLPFSKNATIYEEMNGVIDSDTLKSIVIKHAEMIGASQNTYVIYVDLVHLGIPNFPIPHRANTAVIAVTCCVVFILAVVTIWLTIRRNRQQRLQPKSVEAYSNRSVDGSPSRNGVVNMPRLSEQPHLGSSDNAVTMRIPENITEKPSSFPRLHGNAANTENVASDKQHEKHRRHKRKHHKKKHGRKEAVRKVSNDMLNESHRHSICDELQGDMTGPGAQTVLATSHGLPKTPARPDSPITSVITPHHTSETFDYSLPRNKRTLSTEL